MKKNAYGSKVARCPLAWELCLFNLTLSQSDAAAAAGVGAGTFGAWIRRNHPGVLRRLRAEKFLSQCPKSKRYQKPAALAA